MLEIKPRDERMRMISESAFEPAKSSILFSYPMVHYFQPPRQEGTRVETQLRLISLVVMSVKVNIELEPIVK